MKVTMIFSPDRFRIVRTQPKNDGRVVGNLKGLSLSGKKTSEGAIMPTNVEKVGERPVAEGDSHKELPPGRLHALVERLGPQEMNLYVWDFGVNPRPRPTQMLAAFGTLREIAKRNYSDSAEQSR